MIGIDEVGRGSWAGSLLVVAVRKRRGKRLPTGLHDSKQISRVERERLTTSLLLTCQIGEGWVSVQEIDDLGLTQAIRLGCLRALNEIEATSEEVIILDGSVNFLSGTNYAKAQAVVRADETHSLVSAASIVAKVARDLYMCHQALIYPGFGFDTNVGYGTRQHKEGLDKLGVTRLHRRSFQPIKSRLK